MTQTVPDFTQRPIAIGAIGGSGSRVLAQVVHAAGVSLGSNLNSSNDNLEFTTRFKALGIKNVSDVDFTSRLAEFETLSRIEMQQAGKNHWGWKEPNTHIVIDRIFDYYPAMRYVHLLRNGFDMAFSNNQNQPRLWGSDYLGRPISEPPTPAEILAYFCEVHRRILELASRLHNHSRILIVEYEALCADPESEITRLLDFLELTPEVPLEDLSGVVRQPTSIGRGLAFGLDPFEQEDLAYIRMHLPGMLSAYQEA